MSENHWPRQQDSSFEVCENDPEVKRESQTFAADSETRSVLEEICQRFSSWIRLKVVVAWVLRYRARLQESSKKTGIRQKTGIEPITIDEVVGAEKEIMKGI